MKEPVKNRDLEKRIFAASPANFNRLALDLFQFQYAENPVYRAHCNNLRIKAEAIDKIEKIPFLPISTFKTHAVKTTEFDR